MFTLNSILNSGYMRNEMILKLFQCFISHVTTDSSLCEMKHWNNFKIISK